MANGPGNAYLPCPEPGHCLLDSSIFPSSCSSSYLSFALLIFLLSPLYPFRPFVPSSLSLFWFLPRVPYISPYLWFQLESSSWSSFRLPSLCFFHTRLAHGLGKNETKPPGDTDCATANSVGSALKLMWTRAVNRQPGNRAGNLHRRALGHSKINCEAFPSLGNDWDPIIIIFQNFRNFHIFN